MSILGKSEKGKRNYFESCWNLQAENFTLPNKKVINALWFWFDILPNLRHCFKIQEVGKLIPFYINFDGYWGFLLTINVKFRLSDQFLFLSECSVPNDAFVRGSVISFGWNQGQNRPGRFILVLPTNHSGVQGLSHIGPSIKPVDLRRGDPPTLEQVRFSGLPSVAGWEVEAGEM